MTYVSKPIGYPSGMHYPMVVKKRRELGLDEKGFPVRVKPLPVKREGNSETEGSEDEEGR